MGVSSIPVCTSCSFARSRKTNSDEEKIMLSVLDLRRCQVRSLKEAGIAIPGEKLIAKFIAEQRNVLLDDLVLFPKDVCLGFFMNPEQVNHLYGFFC